MKVVHESKVELLDSMGSDLTVANAARVSFDKASEWEASDTLTDRVVLGFASPDTYLRLSDRDEKLIRYLALHGHWTPFSHVVLQFRLTVPIFVDRQLVKHSVGASRNEVSRRYVDSEPEFYLPKVWRKKAENKKQGSSDDQVNLPAVWEELLDLSVFLPSEVCEQTLRTYSTLISAGVAPEQARMILPLNTMTSYYLTGSLYYFARVVQLRCKPDAQKETRDVAELIREQMNKVCPISTKYLTT